MPTEDEKKQCTFEGCDGTMQWKQFGPTPGSHVGTGTDKGLKWQNEKGAGWYCDKNRDHYAPK